MIEDKETILSRISKLMAKAKGTNNENEAAIFAAKAAEMLAKHNLDEAMLREHDASLEQGPVGGHPYAGRIPDRWRELILMGCAKVYFCKLILSKAGGKKVYTLYGREHNAVVAKLMAEYLITTVKRMAREHSAAKAEQGDFRRGAGEQLYHRLLELYKAQNTPAPSSSTGNTLPALYNDEANAVDAYVNSIFSNLGSVKSRPMKMGASAMVGRSAANGISLNTQVGRKTTARLR